MPSDGLVREGVVVARKAKQAGRLNLILVVGGENGRLEEGYCQFTSMGNKGQKYIITLAGETFVAKNYHSSEWLFYRKSNKRRILAKVTPTSGRMTIRTVRDWASGQACGLEDSRVKGCSLQYTLKRCGSLWKRKFSLNAAANDETLAYLAIDRLTARADGGSWQLDIAQGQTIEPKLQVLVLALAASETIDRR